MTKTSTGKAGFTLIEVMSAMAVLALLIAMLAQMFAVATDSVKRGEGELSRNSAAQLGMETILQAVEGMVVNDRTGCYFQANASDASGFGLDEAWFVTTSTVMNSGKLSGELVHFYVKENTHTNTTGMAYTSYDLMYAARAISDAGRSPRVKGREEWWDEDFADGMEEEILIPNVVRFDFYLVGWDKSTAMTGNKKGEPYFMSTEKNSDGITGIPPAMIDIYIQVAGDESAVEGGSLLYAAEHGGGGNDLKVRGREILVRDSVVYFGRALPVCGPARYLEAIAGKPHHYYVDKD
jgi:prepilin-type N-terminal cleavage/methylation domain-containing protein